MKKRILVVASTMSHIENFHLRYIKKLKENYEVFTMATGVGYTGNKADFDIKFEKKILSFNNLKIIKAIKKVIVENKIDVVILNTTLASFFVRFALKGIKNRPRTINIVHGYLFSKDSNFIKKAVYIMAEKFMKKQTDEVVVMNREDFHLAQKHKFSRNGVVLIDGMGIDGSRFKSVPVAKNLKDGKTVISFIGELSSRKNQKMLIQFVKKMEPFNSNIHLNLIGCGDSQEKLEKLSKKLGVENKIHFVGYDNDISKYLDETDYYVSASKIEGMPFNILEAMFKGMIVFSSEIKGSADIIDDLEAGILFKLNNIDDLIYKFRIVNNDLELQSKIRKNAKQIAKKYEINQVFDKNIELLTKYIEEK